MKKRAEKIRELAGQMENEKSAYERMSKAHKVVAATGEFFRAYLEKMRKNRKLSLFLDKKQKKAPEASASGTLVPHFGRVHPL